MLFAFESNFALDYDDDQELVELTEEFESECETEKESSSTEETEVEKSFDHYLNAKSKFSFMRMMNSNGEYLFISRSLDHFQNIISPPPENA